MGCVRCANEREMYPEQVLAGVVYARLCCECMTEWSGFIRGTDEWAQHIQLEAKRAYIDWCAVSGTAPAFDDVEWLYRANERAQDTIRALALRFIKPLKPECVGPVVRETQVGRESIERTNHRGGGVEGHAGPT